MRETPLLIAMRALFALIGLLCSAAASAASYPAPVHGEYVVRDFQFTSGEVLHELRLHYVTVGAPQRDSAGNIDNAVLLLHGTAGSSAGFLTEAFAGTLFGPGQPLDATRYFIIIPDSIGHGRSTKPSDGLRARFPRYVYDDMVLAQYRLVSEKIGVRHLRLVIGTSMGGMHSWLWAVTYPQFMDAVMPIVCLPVQIGGRNRMQRLLLTDMIRRDPEWKNGEYAQQPQSLLTALELGFLGASGARQLYLEAPTPEAADSLLESSARARLQTTDANDFLYAWEASRTYDPGPRLERIAALVVAVNFEDDEINPPELRILEREIKRVPRGRYVLIPASDVTRGHRSFFLTSLWTGYLVELLAQSQR